MSTTHKPRTLAELRAQRKGLRRKLRETEALIAGQFQLEWKKGLPELDAELQKFTTLAKFFSALAGLERRLRQLRKQVKSWRTGEPTRGGTWVELARVALPLLIGLLTRRAAK